MNFHFKETIKIFRSEFRLLNIERKMVFSIYKINWGLYIGNQKNHND